MSFTIHYQAWGKAEDSWDFKEVPVSLGDGQTLGAHWGFTTQFSDIIEICPASCDVSGLSLDFQQALRRQPGYETVQTLRILDVAKGWEYFQKNEGAIPCSGYLSDNAAEVEQSGFGIASYSDYSKTATENCPHAGKWVEKFGWLCRRLENLHIQGVTHVIMEAYQ